MKTTIYPKKQSRTKIQFDLLDELTEEELGRFEEKADEAGASNLTEHFLDVFVRPPGKKTRPARRPSDE